MAERINIGVMPSPADLAREAAEQERAEHVAAVNNKKVEEERLPDTPIKQKRSSGQIDLDVSDMITEKVTRVTRTFTLGTDTLASLDEAVKTLNTTRSAILEKAFNTWWAAVKKTLTT